MAEGTAETHRLHLLRPAGQRQPGDWGGLIIIGNGIINRTGASRPTSRGRAPGRNPPSSTTAARQRRQQRRDALRAHRVRRVPHRAERGAELAHHGGGRLGTTIEYVQVMGPRRLLRVVRRRGGRPVPHLLRVRRRPLRRLGRLHRAQPVPDRLPVHPPGCPARPGRRRRQRPAGDRERRLLGGELQRRQQQPQRVAARTPSRSSPTSPSSVRRPAPGRPPVATSAMMLRRGTGGLYVNGVVARYSAPRSACADRRPNQVGGATWRSANVYISQTAGASNRRRDEREPREPAVRAGPRGQRHRGRRRDCRQPLHGAPDDLRQQCRQRVRLDVRRPVAAPYRRDERLRRAS
jgi:hypothetical protein